MQKNNSLSYLNKNSLKNISHSSKQSVSSTDKVNSILRQLGKDHLLLNQVQNTEDELTLRKNQFNKNNTTKNEKFSYSNKENNSSMMGLNGIKGQQMMGKVNTLPNNNNGSSSINKNSKQNVVAKKPFNSSSQNHNLHLSLNNLQNSRSSEQSKMQQLKNRFKKIKNNYNANHQSLKNDLVDTKQFDILGVGSNKLNSFDNENNTQEFMINQEDLTFSRSREYRKQQDENQPEQYPFIDNNHNYKHIQHQYIARNISLNVSQVNQHITQRYHQSEEQSTQRQYDMNKNPNNKNSKISKKYHSLSQQLKSVKHNELIQILIEQIQDNEKNKHIIQQYQNSQNDHKMEIKKKDEEMIKLRKQLDEKRNQIQVLLITERKNLELIQKLKGEVGVTSGPANVQKQKIMQMVQKQILLQKQRLLEKEKMLEKERQLAKQRLNQKQKNLEKQIQVQKQRLLQKQMTLETKLRQLAYKAQQNTILPCVNQQPAPVTKNTPSPKQSQQVAYYKQKHFQLQKHMNEYINNTNQAFEQYKRNLSQLKESNYYLSKQLQQRNDQIEQLKGIKNQNSQLKDNIKKLNHSLNNGRNMIRELETEFVEIKDQNERVKRELEMREKECEKMQEKLDNRKDQINRLNEQNRNLITQNKQLSKENTELNHQLAQIQEKIISNTQLEQQVKVMFNLMNDEKLRLQQKQTTLKNQVATSLQTICVLNDKIKVLEEQITKSQKVIKQKNEEIKKQAKQNETKIKDMKEKQQIMDQQCAILQQTNKELQKLQEQLLEQYQNQKETNQRLKQELMNIMTQVRQMQKIYGKELSTNDMIKKQLQTFWVNKLNSASMSSLSSKEQSQGNLKVNNGKQSKNIYKRGSAGSIKQRSKETSQKSSLVHQNIQSNQLESCQISFKKGSLMTKQGSSSLFRNHSSFGQGAYVQKQQQKQKYGVFPSVQGSIISQKYFTQSEDLQGTNQLKILQSSKKGNRLEEFMNKQLCNNDSKVGNKMVLKKEKDFMSKQNI